MRYKYNNVIYWNFHCSAEHLHGCTKIHKTFVILISFVQAKKKTFFFIDNILLPIGALAQWSVNLTPD